MNGNGNGDISYVRGLPPRTLTSTMRQQATPPNGATAPPPPPPLLPIRSLDKRESLSAPPITAEEALEWYDRCLATQSRQWRDDIIIQYCSLMINDEPLANELLTQQLLTTRQAIDHAGRYISCACVIPMASLVD
jgi:hypothetical protein